MGGRIMAISIVTNGYLNVVILVIALYLAIKNNVVLPIPLDDKMEVNPVVVGNVERMLAMAMGMGLFIVAMVVWAQIFPASNMSLEAILP